MLGLAVAFKGQLEFTHHDREVENPEASKSDPVQVGADRDVTCFVGFPGAIGLSPPRE